MDLTSYKRTSPLKIYRILVVIHLKHIKSLLVLLADTFLEKCKKISLKTLIFYNLVINSAKFKKY